MLNEAKSLSNNNSWAKEGQRKAPKMNQSNQKGALRKPLWEEQRSPTKTTLRRTESNKMLRTTKPRRRVLILVIEEGLAKSSKKQHSENTDKWHLCKAGSFSYGETPWTPPLEGTSLHRWNNSVERPWGFLSLFTTCLRLCVKSHSHRLWRVHYPRKAHYEERETLRNANKNKTTRRAGYKQVYDCPPPPPLKHSELKEPHQMLSKTKTLTTITR